jgi:hypothetical protein
MIDVCLDRVINLCCRDAKQPPNTRNADDQVQEHDQGVPPGVRRLFDENDAPCNEYRPPGYRPVDQEYRRRYEQKAKGKLFDCRGGIHLNKALRVIG